MWNEAKSLRKRILSTQARHQDIVWHDGGDAKTACNSNLSMQAWIIESSRHSLSVTNVKMQFSRRSVNSCSVHACIMPRRPAPDYTSSSSEDTTDTRKAPRKSAKKKAKVLGQPTDSGKPGHIWLHSSSIHCIKQPKDIQTELLGWYSNVQETRGMPWRKPYDPSFSRDQRAQRAYEVSNLSPFKRKRLKFLRFGSLKSCYSKPKL